MGKIGSRLNGELRAWIRTGVLLVAMTASVVGTYYRLDGRIQRNAVHILTIQTNDLKHISDQLTGIEGKLDKVCERVARIEGRLNGNPPGE